MTGRPSTYDPKYCEEVVDFLAGGFSVAAFAGHIGVAKGTIYNWMEAHPEFLAAVKAGQAKAVLFWEELNINQARTGEGNATSIIFGLKNRAPEEWRDKHEVEQSGSVNVINRIERVYVEPKRGDTED